MAKILSKDFLQGQIVARFKNAAPHYSVRIIYYRGFFMLCYGVYPAFNLYGKTEILNFLNAEIADNLKMELVNGFTMDDVMKCANTAEMVTVFGANFNKDSVLSLNDLRTNGLNLDISYIEPQPVATDSIELLAHATKATKYGIDMSNLLSQNGIPHVSFQNYSAI